MSPFVPILDSYMGNTLIESPKIFVCLWPNKRWQKIPFHVLYAPGEKSYLEARIYKIYDISKFY